MFTFRSTFIVSKFGSERQGFQLVQILGLLGMYFDAVVVAVKTFLLLFRLALAILCFAKLYRAFGCRTKFYVPKPAL
jgi:hypothetical protein